MNIAFASSTGEKVDQHFGWSKQFYLYKINKESAALLKVVDSSQEPEEEVVSEAPLKGHVLIVEDIEANRMFLSIILDNAGLTHVTAINGLEAIEKFKSEKYDLILMDENMPKLGGIAATKEILIIEKEKDLKHTPIISLTANALKGDKERFLKAGMDDYLSKPIELDMLISTMRKFLG